jgi:SAM-dependent methyltransferase
VTVLISGDCWEGTAPQIQGQWLSKEDRGHEEPNAAGSSAAADLFEGRRQPCSTSREPLSPDHPSNPSAATARYQGEAGRHYQESKRAIPEASLPWVAHLRAEKLRSWVRAEDVVLEYGVGYGWNLAALCCRRRLGFDVAEFLEPLIRAGGIEFVKDTSALSGGLADVVICHHTLEHVLHPPVVLTEIQRLLRPGGRLLLFVPFEREPRYRRFEPEEPNHHLYSWNVQTLGNLVRETGFQVRDAGVDRFGYDRFAAAWACRLHLGETGFRIIRWAAHRVFPAWEVRLVALKAGAGGRADGER